MGCQFDEPLSTEAEADSEVEIESDSQTFDGGTAQAIIVSKTYHQAFKNGECIADVLYNKESDGEALLNKDAPYGQHGEKLQI